MNSSTLLTLGLFGTGVMGQRHIKGLGQLQRVGRLPFRLAGVCDLIPENAQRAAALAEDLLGVRPQIFANFAEMHRALKLDAVTITTMPNVHVDLGIEAFAAGVHVLCEKPIATTVKESWRLVKAGRAAGRKLAVAENYRRDPMNRLGKALLDAGAIGTPYLAIQSSSGSGEFVVITPWRHLKKYCGIAIDMGVHYTDIFEYYLGRVDAVAGFNAVVDKQRKGNDGKLHPADAEDLTTGMLRFKNGAVGNYLLDMAGRGSGHWMRVIHGSEGALTLPPDRSGKPIELMQRRAGKDTAVPQEDLLALMPNFALDDTTAALFGGARLTSYQLDWSVIDSNLLGIEYDDFAQAILQDREPEVNGEDGLRSLALVYGFIEAERAGRVLSADELISGAVAEYQDEL